MFTFSSRDKRLFIYRMRPNCVGSAVSAQRCLTTTAVAMSILQKTGSTWSDLHNKTALNMTEALKNVFLRRLVHFADLGHLVLWTLSLESRKKPSQLSCFCFFSKEPLGERLSDCFQTALCFCHLDGCWLIINYHKPWRYFFFFSALSA